MDDIARRARVHRSTVSLALHDSPRIAAATRARIKQLAEKMGFRPDPLLDAFNFHRKSSAPNASGVVFAFVSDHASRSHFEASAPHREMLAGAREQAAVIGASVDLLLLENRQVTAERLDHILHSRGISGVVLGALSLQTTELALSWARYAAVAVESFHLQPELDAVTLDYAAATRAVVQQLHAAGHTRIGFVDRAGNSLRLQHRALSGYLFECAARRLPRLPPLLVPEPGDWKEAEPWLDAEGPTAIIASSGLGEPTEAPGEQRHPAVHPVFPDGAQPYRRLGAEALALVDLRRQLGPRGLPARRTIFALAAAGS